MSFLLRVGMCTLLLACGQGPTTTQLPPPPPPPPTGSPLRLLFIGNSLTYTFDVPGQVARLAAAAGLATPLVTTRAFPNYSLLDHWNMQTSQQDLATGRYDVVVLQQGASTLESSGVELTQLVGMWSDLARTHGTRPALFVAWAPVGGNFDAGVRHHEAAADSARAALYPVAEAWREALRVAPSLPLYAADGLHASEHGAWLAAIVIAGMVYAKPAGEFPNLFPDLISAEEATILRAAADVVIRMNGRR